MDPWELYRVLQRFLQCGLFNATHAPADADILIEALELNVRTRTGISENLLGPPNITIEDRKLGYLGRNAGGHPRLVDYSL
jgi:hypothetical protein